MPRKILHIDLDAFFCAVEELYQPSLRGKPFAVGGSAEERGVVSSCSYAARIYGVRSAMPMKSALQRCPQLIVLPANHDTYSQYSQQVMNRLANVTPLVEQLSIDEAFLDVSDLPESSEQIARNLQAVINTDLKLPCSIGVAANKLVAKIATDVGKAQIRSDQPPNTITVVPPGGEAQFLSKLPVIALWGVGPKTEMRMRELGIQTIGQLSTWSEDELVRQFGKYGHSLYHYALGKDDSPVVTSHDPKSISQEVTFARDISDGVHLRQTLKKLCERIGMRLRDQELQGRTVKLKLRWPSFETLSRQVTLTHPISLDMEIYAAAEKLFSQNWTPGKHVRLIGVAVSGFDNPPTQLSLWESSPERMQRLQEAIDELRKRYGTGAIHRGTPRDFKPED